MYSVIGVLMKVIFPEDSWWPLYIHSPICTMENCEAMGVEWLVHKNIKRESNLKM